MLTTMTKIVARERWRCGNGASPHISICEEGNAAARAHVDLEGFPNYIEDAVRNTSVAFRDVCSRRHETSQSMPRHSRGSPRLSGLRS
jgi:hypothetical protein